MPKALCKKIRALSAPVAKARAIYEHEQHILEGTNGLHSFHSGLHFKSYFEQVKIHEIQYAVGSNLQIP